MLGVSFLRVIGGMPCRAVPSVNAAGHLRASAVSIFRRERTTFRVPAVAGAPQKLNRVSAHAVLPPARPLQPIRWASTEAAAESTAKPPNAKESSAGAGSVAPAVSRSAPPVRSGNTQHAYVVRNELPGAQSMSQTLANFKAGTVMVIKSTPGFVAKAASATYRGIIFAAKNPTEAWALTKVKGAEAWVATKHELGLYWSGLKRLYADVRIATGLLSRILVGHGISRRERNQLMRTVADLFRLVPVAIFIIIPFMEFLLPVALKLFPNMLPSTFEARYQKEEKLKKELKAKIELAKFLQCTMQEMAEQVKAHSAGETQKLGRDLQKFLSSVQEGRYVHNADIIRFSKLFSDELLMDNLPRSQLVAMCRLMGTSYIGTDAMLRISLRARLRQLKADDRLIYWEGVHELSEEELRMACINRGILWDEFSLEEMRKQLKQWLELSLHREVPQTLMILSRAFFVPGQYTSGAEALQHTLSSMDEEVIESVVHEALGARDAEKEIERLKREQELIEEERMAVTNDDHDREIALESKMRGLGDVVSSTTASKSAVSKELETIEELQQELEGTRDEEAEIIHGDHVLRRVDKRLAKMLKRLNTMAAKTDRAIGSKLQLLDLDNDGVITVDEIKEVLKMVRDKPEEEALQEILERFDPDGDGKVLVRDVEQIVEALESKLEEETS